MTARQVRNEITRLLKKYASARDSGAYGVIPASISQGKLYEAYVLALVTRELVTKEGVNLRLVNDSYVHLKSAPGPINRDYPHIEVEQSGHPIGDLWTDVEFVSLSCWKQGRSATAGKGDYHELDVLLAVPGADDRPLPDQILLGVECKHTNYEKNLLREILGVRRELSFIVDPRRTAFRSWPRTEVPANPPSCLLVFTSDPAVTQYSAPGGFFGIDFHHEPM